jgi:methanethiol S-methyltransferase
MIAWLNAAGMFLTIVLTTVFYVLSVSPVQLEPRFGVRVWKMCAVLRALAGVFMTAHIAGYVVHYFYPVPILPAFFPWPWWVSAVAAVVVSLPLTVVFLLGVKDAGSEALLPDRANPMYGGIYQKIRHPQAVGELPSFVIIALLFHSPFVVLLSLLWLPAGYIFCVAEERDLVLRFGDAYRDYQSRTGMLWPKRGES